jgi:hypothetical protein
MPAAVPDRTGTAKAPKECHGCGADLADPASGSSDAGRAWAQVRDILPVVAEKVHWWLPRRRCGCCKKVATAAVPYAHRRHPRRPGRHTLATGTRNRLTSRTHTREWTRPWNPRPHVAGRLPCPNSKIKTRTAA